MTNDELQVLIKAAKSGNFIKPIPTEHEELGKGLTTMSPDGVTFEPTDKSKKPVFVTWEQYDA